MTTAEITEKIEALGGTLPTEGSGANDAVVKADLEATLAELVDTEATEAVTDELPEGAFINRNGNIQVRH